MSHVIAWPPPYRLRRSKKARYISMRVSESKGLEIVMPLFAKQQQALDFLAENKHWLEKHAKQIHAYQQRTRHKAMTLPRQVHFLFSGEDWTIDYKLSQQSIRIRSAYPLLLFTGAIQQFQDCLPAFKNWLKRKASAQLSSLIRQLALQTGFKFSGLSFREQKTLWGSCSEDKNISLNCKLLFLPYPLVRYVLLHELCHTVHLDHSKQFWALVGEYETHYKALAKSLLDANRFIPDWYID